MAHGSIGKVHYTGVHALCTTGSDQTALPAAYVGLASGRYSTKDDVTISNPISDSESY